MTLKSLTVLVVFLMIQADALVKPADDHPYSSPVAVVVDEHNDRIIVAAHGGKKLVVVDRNDNQRIQEIGLNGNPTGLALSADGSRLFVTTNDHVCVIEAGAGASQSQSVSAMTRWDSGFGACSPVLSPDNGRLFACNRFENTISIFDTTGGQKIATIPVEREPVAATITPDGKRLFVANHLPTGPSDGDFIAAAVSMIDIASNRCKTIRLPNGSMGLRGICASPGGKYVYVTHILARYHLPTTQLERGWMNTNALSIVDVNAGALLNTVLLDDAELGAANPWGVACTDTRVVVSHAGTHELSVIDRVLMHERLDALDAAEAETVSYDLSFLVGARSRIPLDGNGPRGLALSQGKALVAEYYSDSLGVVSLDGKDRTAQSIPLGCTKTLTEARRGEMLFNDGTLCFQQWQSCASCHPDGRADGLNWDLLNDGFGNPKNTKSLLHTFDTPPAMAMGVRDDARVAVRAGIRFILCSVRPEEDAEAIDAYLRIMAPENGKRESNPGRIESANRGKEIFRTAGCGDCHPAPLYTDLKAYNLRLPRGPDTGKNLDTPTLIEVWRTAPYLHDGRAETLEAVFTKHNEGDRHGRTSKLDAQALADLIEYLRTL